MQLLGLFSTMGGRVADTPKLDIVHELVGIQQAEELLGSTDSYRAPHTPLSAGSLGL